MTLRPVLLVLSVAAIAVGIWLGVADRRSAAPPDPELREDDAEGWAAWGVAREGWREMARSERLILEVVSPQLDRLSFAVRNLQLPDARTRGLFATEGVEVGDLDAEPFTEPTREFGNTGGRLRSGRMTGVVHASRAEVRLWRSLFERVAYFHHAKFAVLRGEFLPESGDYEARVIFQGLGSTRAHELAAFEIRQRVRWRKIGSTGEPSDWAIVAWHSEDARRMDAPAALFSDVLEAAVPDAAEYGRARESIHERIVLEYLLDKRTPMREGKRIEFFSFNAQDRHPGLAVVDLDRDGFDDLYVMARWGRNQFFHNRGDGTFEETAAELGLDIDSYSSSAIFADFDNDGDSDLFLGRTLRRSAYFENRDGRFVDVSSEKVDQRLPYLASSISAVDYDADGLLDVYVSTYASGLTGVLVIPEEPANGTRTAPTPTPYFSTRDMNAIVDYSESDEYRPWLSWPGPANVLLRNRGDGRFEVLPRTGPLSTLRNTYQATWADFDRDGDPDVYLANDFAPDNLIRNEGGGVFKDVTDELLHAPLGFGMGVTWGDYDRDGRQDLYVTNMFSKAGSRIASSLDGIDERFGQSARGNFLLRNTDRGMQLVSGDGPGELAVERAGWGWGSLFADVNNDGFLDLFALSGYYSAPPQVAISKDL